MYKKFLLGLCLVAAVGLIGWRLFLDASLWPDENPPAVTDRESAYRADAEITQALQRLQTNPAKANIIRGRNSGRRHVALTFDGLADRTTMQRLLDLLHRYQAKATFFVDGMQTAEDPQTVVNIRKAGQKIENYTLYGQKKMENLAEERLIIDFCRAQKIIQVTADQGPNLLKCNATSYTDNLLRAAKAAGFNAVVASDFFLDVNQISALPTADAFISQIRPGAIISVKLQTDDETIRYEPGKTDLRPAIDKQPGLKELPLTAEQAEPKIVNAVEKLLISLQKANYTTIDVDDFTRLPQQPLSRPSGRLPAAVSRLLLLLDQVRDQAVALFSLPTVYAAEVTDTRAEEIKVIATTEPALSYSFGGLSNTAAVNDVLDKLQRLGIKATFFVMEMEMQRYPATVRQIIANGHEIGLAIRPKAGQTADETRTAIVRGRQLLSEQFGVTTNLIKQPWGAVADATKAAAGSLGCQLIGQSVNVVQSKHKDYASAEQVMAEIFRKSMISLARGQIVHFRMDYYTNNRLVGDLLVLIKQRKIDNIAYATPYDNPVANPANDSQYVIKPVGDVLHNRQFTYRYPADPQLIPEHLRDDGPRITVTQRNFLAEAAKRYIGNIDVDDDDRMLGFSRRDARRLDSSGLVHTEDKVIFLTFDDWGTDAAINKLLYVLRKHQATGTFFIGTNNVLYNANLLRSIALDGHEIASHSDQHKPMAVRDPKTGRQTKTQDKEEYIQDLTVSFQKLRSVTGDVVINGRPALTRFFRPPTLAVSKMGFEVLFATGYEYIVSGSASTGDYEASSVAQLVRTLKAAIYTPGGEVRKGAILVMHMGDSSAYTPMAVDILLTANAAKPDSDPSKFKVGRLSDYLTDGYSQSDRKHSLQLHRQPGKQ